MSWLSTDVIERPVAPVTKEDEANLCLHCKLPVRWDPTDKRASEEGSFVADDGSFTCPNSTLLHQG